MYAIAYAVCCVFFICLGSICVHVLLSAMSHVVFCVSYVLVTYAYVWCGSLWYMCVVENCVSYVVSEFLSIICPDLIVRICENGLPSPLEQPFYPVTGISASHGEAMYSLTEPQVQVCL